MAETPDWLAAYDFTGQETVWLAREQMDAYLADALLRFLPSGTTVAFNYEGARARVKVSKPGTTRAVVEAALASLGRPLTLEPPPS